MIESELTATEVKKVVDIYDVLDYFGAGVQLKMPFVVTDEVEVYCPFCEDKTSKKPAGRVNMLKSVYYCFSCGVGGDVISLASQRDKEQHTFGDDLRWLMDTFGGGGE